MLPLSLLLGEWGRYLDELMKLKAQAHAENNEFITWNDIQASVDHVNRVVQEEHESEWAASAPQAVPQPRMCDPTLSGTLPQGISGNCKKQKSLSI